jgi:hypothetical protein
MSSFKLVQRPVEPPKDEPDLFRERQEKKNEKLQMFETGGIAFPDGRCIELVRDPAGRLRLLDSTRKRGGQKIKCRRRTYISATIAPSIMEALTLPTGRVPSGSTRDVYTKIRVLFADQGTSEEAAKKLTFWALSTWFADTYPMAPCLAITGSQPEAHLILRLLAVVVRHGLPLAEINLSGLRSLPMYIQPTLLIHRLSSATLKLLSASNYPPAYVATRDALTDLYCPKAYVSNHLLGDALDGTFRVDVAPFPGKLPVVSDVALRELAEEFQPALLDYRMRHVAQARDCTFDLPGLPSELRLFGRALGAAILDAPELRAELVELLHEYRDENAADTFNQESIVVEALLSHSHNEQFDQLVYVGQLADISNTLLKDRGSREKLEPKAVGWILRNSLGFTPKRNGKGFGIKMTEGVRRTIHQLARQFQALAVDEVVAGCSQCRETLASDGNEAKIEQGTGPAGTSAA